MGWPRLRLTLRTIMVLVALVAVFLGAGLATVRFRYRMAILSSSYSSASRQHREAEGELVARADDAIDRARRLERRGFFAAAAESHLRAAWSHRQASREAAMERAYEEAARQSWWLQPPEPRSMQLRLLAEQDYHYFIQLLRRRLEG